MPIPLYILFAVLILTLVSGGYVFWIGCVRRKEISWLLEDEIKKTPYGKYYDHIRQADRFLKEHHAQDIYVKSHDGLKLHGLWVPAKNPKGTVLLAHGYRSTKLVDFGMVFPIYHDFGMNILVPDQRAHGKSEGKYITFGVKESRDMQAWITYHNEVFGKYSIILSGLSMGASTMLYLADADLPDNVKGIIADCGFTSPKAILSSVFRMVTHLPPTPSLWVTELCARVFAGFSLTEKDSRKALQNNKYPVLMVHGTDDDFVPCDMTRQGYAVCAGTKELLLVEGADHGTSFLVQQKQYTEKVFAFLNRYL